MMEERGEALVSTKCNSQKKQIIQIVCVVCALIIVWATTGDGFVASMGKNMDSDAFPIIIGGLGMLVGIGGLVDVFLSFRSYCVVYENAISGTTTFNFISNADSLKEFTLNYSEITNVSANKGSIQIYTSYATFKVIAYDNCEEAVREIRNRIGKV